MVFPCTSTWIITDICVHPHPWTPLLLSHVIISLTFSFIYNLFIWAPIFLMSLATGFTNIYLLTNQALNFIDHLFYFLVYILLISSLNFIIPFLLQTLGLVISLFLIPLAVNISCLSEILNLFLRQAWFIWTSLLESLLLCPIDRVLFLFSFLSRNF